MINQIVSWIKKKLAGFFGKQELYTYTVVDNLPSELTQNSVYVAGAENNYWLAAMMCPCGCGATLHMNLLSSHRPCWRVNMHNDKTVSFQPSLWRKTGCKSHFFLKNGLVQWVGNK